MRRGGGTNTLPNSLYQCQPFPNLHCTLHSNLTELDLTKSVHIGVIHIAQLELLWIASGQFLLASALIEQGDRQPALDQLLTDLETALRRAGLSLVLSNQDIMQSHSATITQAMKSLLETIQSSERDKSEQRLMLDLVMMGTPFQTRVWRALLDLPFGETSTYQQIAMSLGQKGARAVGSAIGRNRLAPFIPCHRVIRSNGPISGYRWGNVVKQGLLEFEELALVG